MSLSSGEKGRTNFSVAAIEKSSKIASAFTFCTRGSLVMRAQDISSFMHGVLEKGFRAQWGSNLAVQGR